MPKGLLELRTPEGIDLRIKLASYGRRGAAMIVDLSVIYFLLIIALLATMMLATFSDEWAFAVFILGSFLLRNFYFTGLEIAWSGRTIGKRLLGLRVVDVRGRPLKPNAIFLRNVTRDPEMFLPLIAIFSPETVIPNAPAWLGFFALIWVFIFALFPLFNPYRARVGDLIAGTTVASVPSPKLLDDLTETRAERAIVFSPKQLDMYGVFELQTLESVIRADLNHFEQQRIADTIASKIDFDQTRVGEPSTFLEAFYQALRERLEHRMVLGDRQERKVEGQLRDLE